MTNKTMAYLICPGMMIIAGYYQDATMLGAATIAMALWAIANEIEKQNQ